MKFVFSVLIFVILSSMNVQEGLTDNMEAVTGSRISSSILKQDESLWNPQRVIVQMINRQTGLMISNAEWDGLTRITKRDRQHHHFLLRCEKISLILVTKIYILHLCVKHIVSG
jgi:hypothetical protein